MLMLLMLMLLLILLFMLSLSLVVDHGCGVGCSLLMYAACWLWLAVCCSSDVVHRVVAGAQEEFVIVQGLGLGTNYVPLSKTCVL